MPLVVFSKLGRFGRFCNGAFQVCSTIGIARKNNCDFAFPLWRNYDGLNFESNLDIDVYKRMANPLPLYEGPDLPELGIPFGYHDVMITRDTDLLGHFQSERYFSHCIDEVRHYLTFKDEPKQNDYVGIHFRGGDYGPQASPQHPQGNEYHPRLGMSYYGQAMSLFHGAKFLVFSDSPKEAREMFGDTVDYAEGKDYFEDFKSLKRCRHFVIGNSSFSALAAMLGEAKDKKVVAPRPWFGGAYTTQYQASAEDIYSKEWAVLNWR
jgi:hypothetical protein